ncbi:MAG: hypothetical protein U1E27_06930 [Kiritimatiellia bacterium]|nr:hypothetical protein [Kiritimatiellia bacterium]
MSARHPKAVAWERRLKEIFDSIDSDLEERYGHQYNLHPSRPRRGTTSNPESDGLFNIGAAFSAGFGSKHGPGYLVEIRMATLDRVSAEEQERLEQEVVQMLRERLRQGFPDRKLTVSLDGHVFKIHGDLSLGRV